MQKNLCMSNNCCTFASRNDNQGRLPEWLGIGLQNRGQQFESATDLLKSRLYGRFFNTKGDI